MNAPAARLNAIWYQSASLGAVAVVITGLLALAYQSTRQSVAQAEERDTRLTLEQVLPPGYADNNLLRDVIEIRDAAGNPVKVYRARKNGQVRAVLYAQHGNGYSGRIDLIMAVDSAGVVQGVRITRHTETPGLGDKIEEAKTPWVHAFEGKSLEATGEARWAVKKDGGVFDQFAGATITPRAVVGIVRQGLDFFGANRERLLAATPAAGGKDHE